MVWLYTFNSRDIRKPQTIIIYIVCFKQHWS